MTRPVVCVAVLHFCMQLLCKFRRLYKVVVKISAVILHSINCRISLRLTVVLFLVRYWTDCIPNDDDRTAERRCGQEFDRDVLINIRTSIATSIILLLNCLRV